MWLKMEDSATCDGQIVQHVLFSSRSKAKKKLGYYYYFVIVVLPFISICFCWLWVLVRKLDSLILFLKLSKRLNNNPLIVCERCGFNM